MNNRAEVWAWLVVGFVVIGAVGHFVVLALDALGLIP